MGNSVGEGEEITAVDEMRVGKRKLIQALDGGPVSCAGSLTERVEEK